MGLSQRGCGKYLRVGFITSENNNGASVWGIEDGQLDGGRSFVFPRGREYLGSCVGSAQTAPAPGLSRGEISEEVPWHSGLPAQPGLTVVTWLGVISLKPR